MTNKDETKKIKTAIEDYVLTVDERSNQIPLLIFPKQDYLLLDYFMVDLNISKNTVMPIQIFLSNKKIESTIFFKLDPEIQMCNNDWELKK